jgi:hypothetical protein
MGVKFNPFTGNLDLVDTTTAAGSNTQVQFNDGGSLAGDSGLTFNKTTNALTVGASTVDGGQAKVFGDINLDDGGTFTTTVQTVTPTANRTISFPDATGTVALVAGSSGQLVYNNAGAQAGATGSVVDSSGNVTIGGLTTLAGSPSANNTSGVLINGTWRTGASSNNPQLLLNPSGTTLSTTWSTSGTGIGVNAASGFLGNLLDLQVNGTSAISFTGVDSNTVPKFNINGASNQRFAITTSSGANRGVWLKGGLGIYVGATEVNDTDAATAITSGYIGLRGDIGVLAFASGTNPASTGTHDTIVRRDAANTLAQRNGANAQTFRCYGTYTDASNYVRASLSSNSTAVTLAAETAGTGADNVPLNLTAAGTGTVKVNSVAEVVVSSTVAGLPTSPVVGMLTRVTDATAPAVGSTVTGGGAAAALVWYNGANWTVIGV